MTLTNADIADLRTELAAAHDRGSPRLRAVASEENTAAKAQPDIRDALTALATLPDETWMGAIRNPDGTLGADFTVADIRTWLLDGTWGPDPADIPRSCALMRWARRGRDTHGAAPLRRPRKAP